MGMRRHGGFTLVEVLVAVFVLAAGIVGAAATQATALRLRHESARMSTALQLAMNLADRMRANAGQMRLDDASNPYLHLAYQASADAAPDAPPALCYASTGSCGSVELARFDLHEITEMLRLNLPNGRIVVCRDASLADAPDAAPGWDCAAAPGAPIVVKLGWPGHHAGDGDGDASGSAGAPAPFAPRVTLTVAGAAP